MSHVARPVSGIHQEAFVFVVPTGTERGDAADPCEPAEPPELCETAIVADYFRIKPWVDRGFTAMLLIASLPMMGLTALAILICDGRPLLYRQVRVGKDGRPFKIFKFRTMCQNAETKTGPVWSNQDDRRVTRLGRWLRCSHLDELPQLLNVVRGEMNLIGPRPERPEFVEQLASQIPGYRQRLAVRPGITGFAQLNLGYDSCLSDVARKVEHDLAYIGTATALVDTKLLVATVPHVLAKIVRHRRQMRRRSRRRQRPIGIESVANPEAGVRRRRDGVHLGSAFGPRSTSDPTAEPIVND